MVHGSLVGGPRRCRGCESHGLAIAYRVHSLDSETMVWVHRPRDGEDPDSTWSRRLTPCRTPKRDS